MQGLDLTVNFANLSAASRPTLRPTITYVVELRPDTCGADPCWLAVMPQLRGCMAQGDTARAALRAFADALADYLDATQEETS